MIKKVKVEQLKPGAFVHDFNCGWLHHPFLRNRVKVRTDGDIEKILKYQIHEVYIDTENGVDVDDAPTKSEVDRDIQQKLENLPGERKGGDPEVPLCQAVPRAKRLIKEAKETTKRLLDDAKTGKQIDMHLVAGIVDQMTDSVLSNKDALVSLLRIKHKDEYTYMHSLAVAALCISFARRLELDHKNIKALGIGGLLHDIGKVRIPGEILNKPGPLTEEEFEVMKEHVKHGELILQETTNIDENSLCVTAHHHERLDGTGYPAGLKGDQISPFGQMTAIVDIYDALTSERCYKNAMPPTAAMRKIFEWSNSYLNRDLVESFIAHLGIYPIGTLVRLRSGFIAVVVDHGRKGLLCPVVQAVFDTKRQRFTQPFEIDLSKESKADSLHEIAGCEEPDKWALSPEQYLSRYRRD